MFTARLTPRSSRFWPPSLPRLTNKPTKVQLAGIRFISNHRIIDLIDELLGKIQDSLDLERSAEDKRVAAYTKARRLLGITIGITQTVLANTQSDLARYHFNCKRKR